MAPLKVTVLLLLNSPPNSVTFLLDLQCLPYDLDGPPCEQTHPTTPGSMSIAMSPPPLVSVAVGPTLQPLINAGSTPD